ncbi:MAG: NapC/NirT family cytochrome c, partial [Gammaproteobacteria bacterium]|nr:NapC/NirT family cytochrome c [Gammaproteobacteria bacterium]
HLLGTIDTEEKFEARRKIMAERVWENMQANNSRECRNCHDFSAMIISEQRKRAGKQHNQAQQDGDTCIDCHKGIAHKAVHETELKQEDADEEIQLDF